MSFTDRFLYRSMAMLEREKKSNNPSHNEMGFLCLSCEEGDDFQGV